jgi:hypothetical protein
MNEINISRLVDTARLRPFHLWLTFWRLLAMMADGFDLLNASIAGPALIKQWGIDRASLGPVFSASLAGRTAGVRFRNRSLRSRIVIDIRQRLSVAVVHDEAGIGLLDRPGRREAAVRHLR